MTKISNEKIKRNEFGFFPSLSIWYTINDNHEISLDASHSVFRPSYSIEMDSDSWRFVFRLNNNVFLSKKKDWQAYINYRLRTKGSSVATKFPFTQDLELRLQKIFANSTLSISTSGFIKRKVRLSSNLSADNYTYTQLRITYPIITF